MKKVPLTAAVFALSAFFLACCSFDNTPYAPSVTVAGHEVALKSVLRAIPVEYIEAAKSELHIAYQHTSHGTHVAYGLFGLPDFESGDAALFAITNNAASPSAGKLDFHDYYATPAGVSLGNGIIDLSNGVDTLTDGVPAFVTSTRVYLDNPDYADINVVMWSWCSIGGHNVANYLTGMQKLIGEYGEGGTKIGVGAGQRAVPVTFVFMTGHAESGSNVGTGRPRDQAKLITDYCEANGYYCIDYYSIDTHDMDGAYYEDADDNGYSPVNDLRYYTAWQTAHPLGADWYENRSAPEGSVACGAHNEGDATAAPPYPDNHITANRKAFAAWYVFARIAGWNP